MKTTGMVLAAWLLLVTTAAAEPDETWVQGAVQQMRASDANAWQRIPWTSSLLEARAASLREGRPLLLFSYEGNLETGRC
jgi:hypothetical protein